jgi:hypothetical protein
MRRALESASCTREAASAFMSTLMFGPSDHASPQKHSAHAGSIAIAASNDRDASAALNPQTRIIPCAK